MESITVKRGETYYLLYNLTSENVREFYNDSQKLTEYFTDCLRTGSNICIETNEGNSSAQAPTTSRFSFLCGHFENRNFIYAVKFANHIWHYFDEFDSIITEHGSLPASMNSFISGLDKVRSINVNLNEDQSKNYFNNGKFIFKNKELQTFMVLGNFLPYESNRQKSSESKTAVEGTARLVFVSGQTSPLLFLNQFEKCSDVKTDKDKMYKIRNFVDEGHKAEFSNLYFTSNWHSVRSAFLQMYSLSFTENKKRELDIDFNGANTLRSFIERKLISLSKFTTLPFINQLEIALNDLPTEISSLFIVNEKITCCNNEILDFCDSIEDIVDTWRETAKVGENDQESNHPNQTDHPVNRMEVFNFMSMDVESGPESSRIRDRGGRSGRGRGVREGVVKRGRPPKKMKSIFEDHGESSDYNFLNQIDNTSRSSWSDAGPNI